MYQFSDNLNWDVFFRFDKKWIEGMNWASLPKASKAVLPVIAGHCNQAGESFPSETTIAILSGLREKAVRAGVNGLVGFPGFHISHHVTNRGRRAKRFRLEFPPERERGRSFFFFKSVIEGGNWGLLKPVAQALYPVMRYYGRFDKDIYLELEDEDEDNYSGGAFSEAYSERKWDICEAEIPLMQELAGISRQSLYDALIDLEKRCLIESLPRTGDGVRRWKVFIRLHSCYERKWLNNNVVSKFLQKEDRQNLTGHGVQKKKNNHKKAYLR